MHAFLLALLLQVQAITNGDPAVPPTPETEPACRQPATVRNPRVEANLPVTLVGQTGTGLGPASRQIERPDTVVVCPQPLREALEPWLEYRGRQGHRFHMVSNLKTPQEIRAAIREAARGGKLRFVLLVGEDHPAAADDPQIRARSVPSHKATAKVNIHWGSEPDIATDHWYADLNDDGLPDVAIGRLSAATPGELTTIIRKIIAYETSRGPGLWRRRVDLVAGVGGFGLLADAAIERGAKMLITDGIPPGYETSMTYASWQSPYCPDPRQFHQTTLDRLNQGSLFWVYMGHGERQRLDPVRVPGRMYRILEAGDLAKLATERGNSPIALFLACYTGAFDGAEPCLAEIMLRTEGAPVAVIAGSRVTMPYAMSVLAGELLHECFTYRRETVGELLMHAKRGMAAVSDEPSATRRMLDTVARLASPRGTDLAAERMEHLLLFNLLGDPALRIPHPSTVELDVPRLADSGGKLTLVGRSPLAGRCVVELVARRDQLTFTPPQRRQFAADDESLAAYQDVYHRANDDRWHRQELVVPRGAFELTIDVPPEAVGRSHVRVFVQGESDVALGAADVYLRRLRSSSSATPAKPESPSHTDAGSGIGT